MKILNRLAILLVIPTLFLTSCKSGVSKTQKSSPSFQQSISINITSEPQTLDPRKARDLNDINLIKMFMDGLTRIDKNGKPSLALAEKIQLSTDLMTYTITLKNAKWSNGDPVTSHDFAYAWKKSLSPTFNAPNANMLYAIKNAKKAKTGQLPLSLIGVETPNDQTLVIQLNHPTPYFEGLLAHPVFFAVNAKLDRVDPHWAENQSTFVGNGPFALKEWKHHNFISASKNPSYWEKQVVQLSEVKMVMVAEETGFRMFEAHELNWDGSPFSTIPVDAVQALRSQNQVSIQPTLGTQWIRINIANTPFESQKLRRAFGLAINRQAIIEHVTQGGQIPATGIVPETLGLQESPYFQDANVEAAQALFQEALQDAGLSVENFPEVKLTYASTDRGHRVAQALQDQWFQAFGVKVTLEGIERKVYFDRVSKRDYTLSLGSWIADFQDPINFLEVFKTKDVGTNNTNWENPGYTELLEMSYQCKSQEERLSILSQSEKMIIEEMPVIPIFHYTMLYMKDQSLQDVVLTSMGDIDFKWAHLDKK